MEIQRSSHKQKGVPAVTKGLPALSAPDVGVTDSALEVFTDFLAEVGAVVMASPTESRKPSPKSTSVCRRSARLTKKPAPPSDVPPSTMGQLGGSSAADEVTLMSFYFLFFRFRKCNIQHCEGSLAAHATMKACPP